MKEFLTAVFLASLWTIALFALSHRVGSFANATFGRAAAAIAGASQ